MKERIPMNFNWFFSQKFLDKHLYEFNDTEGFELVDLPHSAYTTPYNYFSEESITGVCTYKKVIFIKKEYYGQKVKLLFEGVLHLATIYVNDHFVLEHKGGYDEFYADITDFVEYGKNNIITVVVNNIHNEKVPPFGSYLPFLAYSGIYREVYLEVSGEERILECKVRTPNVKENISAYCDVTVSKFPVNIEITVSYNGDVKLSRGYNIYQRSNVLEFSIPDRLLWDVNNPNLYNINVEMVDSGVVLDSINFNYGYREIEVKKDGFYLNGECIKLIGLSRSQSYPYVGLAMPKSVQEKDADILKYDLGLNCVYLNNMIHSKHFINRCDEIGLLVIEEVPGWRFIGSDEFKVNVIRNLKSMISRDINHPSVVMWSVEINEASVDKGLSTEAYKVSHLLDTTRPTLGTCKYDGVNFIQDIYGFSEDKGLFKKIFKNKLLKHKPTMIINHTGSKYFTKKTDSEGIRINQALKHLDVMNYYMPTDNIGIIGSNLTDINTNNNFGSEDNVIYNGVLDMYRTEKEAGYVYKSMQLDKPVLYLGSSLSRDDYENQELNEIYLFTNLDFVDIYRNDMLLGRYRPNKKKYPFLKYPPVILTDLIGDLFITSENIKYQDSVKLKKIIKKIENGKLSKIDKINMNLLMIKYKMKYDDLLNLYYKYLIGEPNKDQVYRFEGYRNNEHLKTIYYSKNKNSKVTILKDKDVLVEDETYDATRVVIKVTDEYDNPLHYVSCSVSIKTYGGVDLIGPSHSILTGGSFAFWVRTNGKDSKGYVAVNINNEMYNASFEIIKK